MKILPAIDLMNGKAVQLEGGNPEKVKYEVDPFEKAEEFSRARVLWIVDLDAALERGSNLEIIKQLLKKYKCYVGGGIRSKELADELLEAGAEKICIGTKALEDPKFLENFDKEKVILALDFKNGKLQKKGWTEDVEMPEINAKYVLVTNVSVEGREAGPDFEFIQNIVKKYENVIISGGISSLSDIQKVRKAGAYSAVIGSALYSGKIKLSEVLEILPKRILPCLDVLNGKVRKGIKFNLQKYKGDPVELAKEYYKQGADELVFLDIGATIQSKNTMLDVVEQVSKQVFIPLTVGGGVRTLEDIKNLLRAGADRVSMNTAAVKNPDLITQASEKFGSQCIVVAIDAMSDGTVMIKGGTEKTDLNVVDWAKKCEQLGAGEILLTCFDADGTKQGYNIELTKSIYTTVNIPLIASGGAGSLEDVYDVMPVCDAALAASIFHFSEYTVQDVKNFLKEKGVVVR